VCENVEHKNLPRFIINPGDQSVLIIGNVENGPTPDDIRTAECGPELGEIVPNTSLHGVVPGQKTSLRIRMSVDKLFDSLQRNNAQYIMFSYLRTKSKFGRWHGVRTR